MGVDYFAYLQTYIHDEPIAIGPFVKTKDGEYKLATVLEVRSAFRKAYEWLQEKPYKAGLPEKLCPELYKSSVYMNLILVSIRVGKIITSLVWVCLDSATLRV